MPKVRSQTVYFDHKKYVRTITVNSAGVFEIIVPPAACKALGIDKVTGESIKEAVRAWDAVAKKYVESKSVQRKVIWYEFKANCYILDDDDIVSEHMDGISFANGVALSLCAGVFIETRTDHQGDRSTVRYERVQETTLPPSMCQNQSGWGPASYGSYDEEEQRHIIDWTPEREAFFAQMGQAMDGLILKMLAVMGDRARLLEIADTGKALSFDADKE